MLSEKNILIKKKNFRTLSYFIKRNSINPKIMILMKVYVYINHEGLYL